MCQKPPKERLASLSVLGERMRRGGGEGRESGGGFKEETRVEAQEVGFVGEARPGEKGEKGEEGVDNAAAGEEKRKGVGPFSAAAVDHPRLSLFFFAATCSLLRKESRGGEGGGGLS